MAIPKIYDCFMFFNELDLLELRFNELYDVVHKFVLVESRYTHSGKPKPLHFDNNKARFSKWMDKVIHVVVDEFPEYPEGDGFFSPSWRRENFQRKALFRGLTDCSDDDIITVTDADEIPRAESLLSYSKEQGVCCLEMIMSYYYMNYIGTGKDRTWYHAKIAPFGMLKKLDVCILRYTIHNQYLETPELNFYLGVVENSGWHFSFLGGADAIATKIKAYCHQELNKDEYVNKDHIDKVLSNGDDIFNRKISYIQTEIDGIYPKYVVGNIPHYQSLGFIKAADVVPEEKIQDKMKRLNDDNAYCLGDKVKNKTVIDIRNIMSQLPEGWFDEEDVVNLRRLAESMPDGGVMVQLGVYKGRSVCCLADIIKKKNLKLIAVDTFEGDEDIRSLLGQINKDVLCKEWFENLHLFNISDFVKTLCDTTQKASFMVEDQSVDLLFIDADHRYDCVKADLDAWTQKVKDGGIICGHDYFSPNVSRAVHDKFGQENIKNLIRMWQVINLTKQDINNIIVKDKLIASDRFIYEEVVQFNCYGLNKIDVAGQNVVDIGGNVGMFAFLCNSYGAKEIVSFEPNERNFGLLQDNMKSYSNVFPIQMAVFAPNVKEVEVAGEDDVCRVGVNENSSGPKVKCVSLKEALDTFPEDNNIILKMDCEGSEYSILLNSNPNDIRRCKTIFAEFHEHEHEHEHRYPGQTIDMLESYMIGLGYMLEPVTQMGVPGYWSYDPKTQACTIFTAFHNDKIRNRIVKFVRKDNPAKVYDCFSFFNELDLLEIRLNELSKYVDYFILSEMEVTHSGKSKPLYFEQNKERFKKFLHKIVHVVVKGCPNSEDPWIREHYQRSYLMNALSNCSDRDIIIVSDVDEIPRGEKIKTYTGQRDWMYFDQKQYNYYLNLEAEPLKPKKGVFSRITTYGNLKRLVLNPTDLRYRDIVEADKISNGGWHFSWLGGGKNIVQKLESWAHQELNLPTYKNIEVIEKNILNCTDAFGRDAGNKTQVVDIDSTFPAFVAERKDELIKKRLLYPKINPDSHDILKRIEDAGSDNIYVFGGKFNGGYRALQNPKELAGFLSDYQSTNFENYLEIGAAMAGLTRLVCDHINIRNVYTIDLGLPVAIGTENILSTYADNIAGLKNSGKLHQFEGDSHSEKAREWLSQFGKVFDLIFIDGDHSYDGVKADTFLALNFAKEDCLFVLHDHAAVPEVEKFYKEIRNGDIPELSFVKEYVSDDSMKKGICVFSYSSKNGLKKLEKIKNKVLSVGSDNLDNFGGAFRGGYWLQQDTDEISMFLLDYLDLKVENYLEIGIATAGLTRLISECLNIKNMYTIDYGSYRVAVEDFLRQSYADNIAGLKNSGKLHQFEGDSHSEKARQWLSQFGKVFDLIFIDGDHSYDGVRADTLLALNSAKEGCLFVLHDHVVWTDIKRFCEEIKNGTIPELSFVKEYASNNATSKGICVFQYASKKEISDSTNDKVAIVMPYYNDKDLLMRSVTGVLNQSHKNWDLFIVDDGSLPHNKASLVCSHYASNRIKIIEKTNGGVSVARNTALEMINKDHSYSYVAYCDSDDIWSDNYLSSQLENLTDCDFVYSEVKHKYENGVTAFPYGIPNPPEYPGLKYMLDSPFIYISSVVHRIGCLSVGYFDSQLNSIEDWDMWARIAEAGYRIKKNKSTYIVYTVKHSNNMASKRNENIYKVFRNKHSLFAMSD